MKSHGFSRRTRQSGFTLVEIAIVLVIVGLLLAGVLKGQELIESSRTRAAAAELNSISAANNAYVDRFRRAGLAPGHGHQHPGALPRAGAEPPSP